MNHSSAEPSGRFGGYFAGLSSVLTLVGVCYFLSARVVLPVVAQWIIVGSILGGLFLIVWFIRFAGHVAARVDLAAANKGLKRQKSTVWRWGTKLGLTIILAGLSGSGVFSSLFLFFDGPDIMRLAAFQTNDTLAHLKLRATAGLKVGEYEELVARVRSNQAQLHNEIFSPSGMCGIGRDGRAAIARIAADMPSFPEINGTIGERNCNDIAELKRIEDAYVSAINAGLRNHPLVIRHDVAQRQALIREIDALLLRGGQEINAIISDLTGGLNFLLEPELYLKSLRALQDISNQYRFLRQQVIGFAPHENASLPEVIDLGPAQNMTSGLRSFVGLVSQQSWYKLLIFAASAFLMDFIVIYCTAAAIHQKRALMRFMEGVDHAVRFIGSDAQYLWSAPPANDPIAIFGCSGRTLSPVHEGKPS